MKTIKNICVALLCAMTVLPSVAQHTMDDMELITVNENVTTVITASEPIRFVDISTDKIAGDQPISNTVRLKPKEGVETNHDGLILGIVTIITERYRTQYALIYTSRSQEAVTDKEIKENEKIAYNNPAVTMSTDDMTRFARKVWNSPARIHNIGAKMHKMYMRLNNIYSVGDYFFIDFSVENKTNIRFDIDQLRVKLSDKKQVKATNVQMIELKPELVLDESRSFKYGYRNVIVVKKMTFPNDKILTIEMSENQISGRNIQMSIDYEDVLSADSFSQNMLNQE